MPAFLLKTPDEDAAITSLALPWRGALPLSVVYRENGEAAYVRPGKIVPATLKAELEKVLAPKAARRISLKSSSLESRERNPALTFQTSRTSRTFQTQTCDP